MACAVPQRKSLIICSNFSQVPWLRRHIIIVVFWLFALFVITSANAEILRVGQGQKYDALHSAVAAAHNGDTIELMPGTYYDCAVIAQDNLTIQGAGPETVLTDTTCQGKALLVIDGSDVTVRGLTLQRARVPDGNGAGVRAEGGNLLIENTRFLNNEDGILAASSPAATIRVLGSTFISNGRCASNCAHGIYVNRLRLLHIENSIFESTKEGHHIKSRASTTEIIHNQITDGPNGTSSYLIDIPNGGNVIVKDNIMEKGPNASNTGTAIMIGAEGVTQPTDELVFVDNRFTNDQDRWTTFVHNVTATPALLSGNIFAGQVHPLIGDGSNN